MIVVRHYDVGYAWQVTGEIVFAAQGLGRQTIDMGYAVADHALRDAWTWWPELPALIYTRRP